MEDFPSNAFSPGRSFAEKGSVTLGHRPLGSIYVMAFHWGLSSVASMGGELYPSSVAETMLAICVTICGFFIASVRAALAGRSSALRFTV